MSEQRCDPLALLRGRQSVRRFLPQPVPREVTWRILEAATWAPSAHNRQPWRFAVLESAEAKENLAQRMGAAFYQDLLADGLASKEAQEQVDRSRQRITQAPLAIVLCLDPTVGDQYSDNGRQQAEYIMGTQGVAMAGATLLLAAHAEGLGGVWVCAPLFAPDTVREALHLPQEWQPQALLLVGYPAKTPSRRPRRPVTEITRYL